MGAMLSIVVLELFDSFDFDTANTEMTKNKDFSSFSSVFVVIIKYLRVLPDTILSGEFPQTSILLGMGTQYFRQFRIRGNIYFLNF